MDKIPASLKLAQRMSDELENRNAHSVVGLPEELHKAMLPWLGEKVMMKLMRELERALQRVY